MLLQLLCSLAAVALIGPPIAREPPYATDAALKRKEKKKKKEYLRGIQRRAHELTQVCILHVGQSCSVFSLRISLYG